ncbi:MAG: FliG C-terminal domain-containing protein [Bacteriovoracia bacterium]
MVKHSFNYRQIILWGLTLYLTLATPFAFGSSYQDYERVKRASETQVRNIVQPLVSKYCQDQCELLNVEAEVKTDDPAAIAPGFEDTDTAGGLRLVPAVVRVKLLIDEMVGPNLRRNLIDLIHKHLNAMEYPVAIDTTLTRFPQPLNSARKVAELRDKVTKQFKETLGQLFNQFCPEQCLLADYDIKVEPVNLEETQYGSSGEYVQDGDTAIRVKKVTGTVLLDTTLTPDEQNNIIEMTKLKTSYLKNVELMAQTMTFPHPLPFEGDGKLGVGRGGLAGRGGKSLSESRSLASNSDSKSTLSKLDKQNSTSNSTNSNNSTNSSSNNVNSKDAIEKNENATKNEKFERYEKIERVEDGDAVQEQLKRYGLIALVFGCSVVALMVLMWIALARRNDRGRAGGLPRFIQGITPEFLQPKAPAAGDGGVGSGRGELIAKRYEIEQLCEELTKVFAEQPKVAKHVFTRILTEEGVEITADYLAIFGETIVMDMLRDPNLQRDLTELMEFFAKNQIELNDDEKLDRLKRLHNRTVASKLIVMGKRTSNSFEFLFDMDSLQVLELIKNESVTVKAIVITQCDPQKRTAIFNHLDEPTRMKLLNELSRIDYLPRDYIFNVANALKRKRQDNPKLNTEALPGSDVLVGLLERTPFDIQRNVVQQLEATNPDNARAVKSKLVSIDTLTYLRDAQLLEMVMGLKHDELLQFLKGAPKHICDTIYRKAPKELVEELNEELGSVSEVGRDAYQTIERKLINRIKVMANEGHINLVETNERMFTDRQSNVEAITRGGQGGDGNTGGMTGTGGQFKKVAGW